MGGCDSEMVRSKDEKGSVGPGGWAKKYYNINLPRSTNHLLGAFEQFRDEAGPRVYSA